MFPSPTGSTIPLTADTLSSVRHLFIEGDRNFNVAKARGSDRDITAAYGTALAPDAPRRNVVTSGIRRNEPCRLSQIRTDPRTLEFFAGKGGLRARILTDGVLEVGAGIEAVK